MHGIAFLFVVDYRIYNEETYNLFQSSLISRKPKVTVLFITVKIDSRIATPMLSIKMYSQIVVYFYRTRLHSLNIKNVVTIKKKKILKL